MARRTSVRRLARRAARRARGCSSLRAEAEAAGAPASHAQWTLVRVAAAVPLASRARASPAAAAAPGPQQPAVRAARRRRDALAASLADRAYLPPAALVRASAPSVAVVVAAATSVVVVAVKVAAGSVVVAAAGGIEPRPGGRLRGHRHHGHAIGLDQLYRLCPCHHQRLEHHVPDGSGRQLHGHHDRRADAVAERVGGAAIRRFVHRQRRRDRHALWDPSGRNRRYLSLHDHSLERDLARRFADLHADGLAGVEHDICVERVDRRSRARRRA